MKFVTKLWKRSPSSHATTVPRVAVLTLEEGKPYDVEWTYDPKRDEWHVKFRKRGKR